MTSANVLFFVLLVIASVLLAWIDFRSGIIPNWLNLLLALLGLSSAFMFGDWDSVFWAIVAGFFIGGVAWILREAYFRLRQFHGFGLGDVKLLAASAIWIGASGVLLQIILASTTAIVVLGVLYARGQAMTRQTALPFGPFLAFGLVTTFTLQQSGWWQLAA